MTISGEFEVIRAGGDWLRASGHFSAVFSLLCGEVRYKFERTSADKMLASNVTAFVTNFTKKSIDFPLFDSDINRKLMDIAKLQLKRGEESVLGELMECAKHSIGRMHKIIINNVLSQFNLPYDMIFPD